LILIRPRPRLQWVTATAVFFLPKHCTDSFGAAMIGWLGFSFGGLVAAKRLKTHAGKWGRGGRGKEGYKGEGAFRVLS
jgi:hypothetical protein